MAGDGMRSQQLHAVFGAEDALVDEMQVAFGSPGEPGRPDPVERDDSSGGG